MTILIPAIRSACWTFVIGMLLRAFTSHAER